MGSILRHPPVKFLCGVLYREEAIYTEALAAMAREFGAVDFESEVMPFYHTDYYQAEMGEGLLRRFVAFEPLRPPEELVAAKHTTNALEDRFRRPNGTRRVNLDIGYLAPAKVVLATTKDHGHRIYLGKGIFAELEYWYQFGEFSVLPWTFPDYRTDAYRSLFRRIREQYLAQLAEAGIPARCYPGDPLG